MALEEARAARPGAQPRSRSRVVRWCSLRSLWSSLSVLPGRLARNRSIWLPARGRGGHDDHAAVVRPPCPARRRAGRNRRVLHLLLREGNANLVPAHHFVDCAHTAGSRPVAGRAKSKSLFPPPSSPPPVAAAIA